jgi:type I restriction enzyme M protein
MRTYGEKVYTDLNTIEKELLEWCEKSDLDLSAKHRKELCNAAHWEKYKAFYEFAKMMMHEIGGDEYRDFNQFQEKVNNTVKKHKLKLTAPQLNVILSAVSWYDDSAEKVIKKTQKLGGDKLFELLQHLDCTEAQLPDYGYFPTGKASEYIVYENQTDLRDSESIPLAENIHAYFLKEVKPHVEEAWIDLDKTKIGYEISFNKYFYQHKPLRSLEEVSEEILTLEQENDGLIMDILNLA